MKHFRDLFLVLSFAIFSFALIGCGNGSDPTLAEVRNAILSVHGEENSFAALIGAFVKGYNIQQITDGAMSGLIEADGDILDGPNGSVLPPANAPVGAISSKALQVNIEARFLTIEKDFLEEIGIDFDIPNGPLDIPLELAETGHSATQILNGIDQQLINLNPDTGFFGIYTDSTQMEFVLNQINRQSAIQITTNPTIIPIVSPVVSDDSDINDSGDTSTVNGGSSNTNSSPTFISISKTSITGTHRKNQDPCPTDFGNFMITNLSSTPVQVDLRSTNTSIQLTVTPTIVLGGLVSQEIGVEFNCKTQVPFVSQIPIVGRLFQNGQADTEKQNLLIFVTANIIDPDE